MSTTGMLEETIAWAVFYLNESQMAVSLEAVEDWTEEIESLVNGLEVDKALAEGTLRDRNPNSGDLLDDRPTRRQHFDLISDSGDSDAEYGHSSNHDLDRLAANLKDASKGVVVDTTLSDYANYWNQFKDFAVTIGKVKSPEQLDALFPNIPVDFPMWIT